MIHLYVKFDKYFLRHFFDVDAIILNTIEAIMGIYIGVSRSPFA